MRGRVPSKGHDVVYYVRQLVRLETLDSESENLWSLRKITFIH